jgi:hypothetical protein
MGRWDLRRLLRCVASSAYGPFWVWPGCSWCLLGALWVATAGLLAHHREGPLRGYLSTAAVPTSLLLTLLLAPLASYWHATWHATGTRLGAFSHAT